ncbi:hypothetical protein [Lichenifustis flavocetrariae]|uniref:Uncharacterized protein n=1 Tax=Lichenifustis flavocetrariae TaxID=2949735 RepID=A0AA41YYW2_9HYPH|nr:hypothetical protein [Lichenifustis flavocetrariae]MCW6509836.1 hypothetical protein [Lichenifustis flavocetrariae]
MKRPITPAYTFTPASSTLNLSGIAGFDVRNLFAVIDLKTGALIYAPLAGTGYSALSGTTLTLAASMSGLSASDPLLILYDDGGKPAEDGTDATGVTIPSGGVGIRGWLSGIYKVLSGTLTVTMGKTASAGDVAVTAGGTAQTLFSGATPANGWKVANPDPAEDLWVSDSTTAAPNGLGSYRVPAGGIITTEPGERPVGPVSVYGATTGHVVTARSW